MESKTKIQSGAKVVVKGRDLPISTKKSMVLCKLIRNKKIDPSLKLLDEVIKKKKGIKLNKKETLKAGKGTKYPISTAKYFVKMIKSLNANAGSKGFDQSKLVISLAKADKAARPMKPGSRLRKFKRTHVILEGKVVEDKK